MSIFQRIYNWFFRIKTPIWVRELGFDLQTAIGDALVELGQRTYNLLQEKIILEAQSNKPSAEKFKAVFDYAKKLGVGLKDSALNAVINAIVLVLKNKGAIK